MWKSAKGYVIIQISGYKAERVLERMRKSGIRARDIRQTADHTLELTVTPREFRGMRPLMRKSRCRVKILKRGGVPFRIHALWKRPALWVTTAILIASCCFLSTRIWSIRVAGTSRVPQGIVLRALREKGVFVGAAKPKTDLISLAGAIRGFDERIAWADVALSGVVLSVDVVESPREAVLTDPTIPHDVTAVKGGVIVSIGAYEGQPRCAVGDRVKAGDTLISGVVDLPEKDEPLLVHARGLVWAHVFYFAEYTAEKTRLTLTDTGCALNYRSVLICGVRLYETSVPFAAYEIRNVKRKVVSDAFLPIELIEGVAYEQAETQTPDTLAGMRESALVEAEKLALLKIPKDALIVSKSAALTEEGGVITAIVGIVTEESIGLEKEIEA